MAQSYLYNDISIEKTHRITEITNTSVYPLHMLNIHEDISQLYTVRNCTCKGRNTCCIDTPEQLTFFQQKKIA